MREVNTYPDKADQFCGNFMPNAPVARGKCETLDEAHARQREWLAKMYFGPPKANQYIAIEEMLTWGWVGLYLREDCDLSEIDVYWPFVKSLLRDITFEK